MGTTSANMGLQIPTIGVDSGLAWEQAINSNTGIIDQHNHTPGFGNPITPSGININADLLFNGYNATLLRSDRFQVQSTLLSQASDIGCIYVSGVDLYYNDISGNKIKLTSGGAVNATSTGISSGTASASFVSSTLVVNAAATTPANIQSASILLGNTGVAGSKYLSLSPPSALAANYALVLPTVPSVTSIMALDTSGNMSAPYTVDNSTIEISTNIIKVKPQGITNTELAANAVETVNILPQSVTSDVLASTVGDNSGSVGYQRVTSGSYTTIATTVVGFSGNRSVLVSFQPDGTSTNESYLHSTTAASLKLNVAVTGVNNDVAFWALTFGNNLTNLQIVLPLAVYGLGSQNYTFTLSGKVTTTGINNYIEANYMTLTVTEL